MARLLAVAVILVLATAPSAFADTRSVTLADPQETTCTYTQCAPDILSVAVTYDSTGSVTATVLFAAPLPAAGASPAGIRDSIARIDLGAGLTGDGRVCTPTGTPGSLVGSPGDVRIEVGAYDGGFTTSSAARGVLYIAGSPTVLPMARTISADLGVLTVSATSPALANLALACAQADLADDDPTVVAVRDSVAHGWFPGYATPPAIIRVEATVTSPTTATIRTVVSTGGGPATLHVGYGTGAASYHPTPETSPFTANATVTWKLRALMPGAIYHYRSVLTGGGVSVYSVDQTFVMERIVPLTPALVVAPSVRGAAHAAATLMCKPGRWKNASAFTYTWLRDGRRVAGETHRSYVVALADRGHFLRCRVAASNARRSAAAVSRRLLVARR